MHCKITLAKVCSIYTMMKCSTLQWFISLFSVRKISAALSNHPDEPLSHTNCFMPETVHKPSRIADVLDYFITVHWCISQTVGRICSASPSLCFSFPHHVFLSPSLPFPSLQVVGKSVCPFSSMYRTEQRAFILLIVVCVDLTNTEW